MEAMDWEAACMTHCVVRLAGKPDAHRKMGKPKIIS